MGRTTKSYGHRTVVLRSIGLFIGAALQIAAARAAAEATGLGATLRLIRGPVVNGVAEIGLQIGLKPGWHTYWRYPGDSGVPPDLTDAGSQNIAGFSVDYPAPMRFVSGSDQTIGYEGAPTFILKVRLADPTKPASLALDARIGVCREICVPVDETLTLPIDPNIGPSLTDVDALKLADAALPSRVDAGADLSVVSIARNADAKPPNVTVDVKNTGDDVVDVFVEGPDGWALPLPTRTAQDAHSSKWQFALDGLPTGAVTKGAPLTFTIVGKTRAGVQTVTLP